MFPAILSKEQKELLPLIKKFSKEYFLVGGTAIGLQIGHRMSVDFDLFTPQKIKRVSIKKIIDAGNFSTEKIIFEAEEQMHIPVNKVKMTFFNYPFNVVHPLWYKDVISMPTLLDLGAMKAYALGGRAKWRDYVDLYFILKNYHSFSEITERSNKLFGSFFNAKLFHEQLSYFGDVDYSQQVQFIGNTIPEDEIKNFLIDIATTAF